MPGVLDFYGDFRIGGPFGVIGGFNRDLGWSTTNNAPDLDEIYALDVAPGLSDHVLSTARRFRWSRARDGRVQERHRIPHRDARVWRTPWAR